MRGKTKIDVYQRLLVQKKSTLCARLLYMPFEILFLIACTPLLVATRSGGKKKACRQSTMKIKQDFLGIALIPHTMFDVNKLPNNVIPCPTDKVTLT